MFTNRNFWIGALLAYGIAFFMPPRALFGRKSG